MSQPVEDQIASLQQEVDSLAFVGFGQEDALVLAKTLLSLAEADDLRVAIGIDLGEQIIFRAALPGTNADYQTWIDRKFKAVRRFGRSSLELELRSRAEPGFANERALDPAHYALVGGAVPILIGKTMVGCIGCAGLASNDDHRLVVRALKKYQNRIDV